MPNSEAITPIVVAEDGTRVLSKADQKTLDALTRRLEKNLQDTVGHLVEIGRDLMQAKELVGHGGFEKWLGVNFDLSDQTARRFMHVAEAFGDQVEALKGLSLSCVYLLAAPSTPNTVREAVLQKVQDGEKVSLATIQELRQVSGESADTDDGEIPVKESSFRSEIRKVNKKISVWSEQIQKNWQGIDGAIGKKSKAELETLHQELAQFVTMLGTMLQVAKEPPKQTRNRKPSESIKAKSISKGKRGRPKGKKK